MRIDVEELFAMQKRRDEICSIPLEQIEFFQDGKKLEFDPKAISEFRYAAFHNIDFILLNYQDCEMEEDGKISRPYAPSPLKIPEFLAALTERR